MLCIRLRQRPQGASCSLSLSSGWNSNTPAGSSCSRQHNFIRSGAPQFLPSMSESMASRGRPSFFSPLEAEGQGTSLCTGACSAPTHATPCSTSPAARPRASPPLCPALIAFHVVPVIPPINPSVRSLATSRATPPSPRFRLGPISFDLGVLRILVAIPQSSIPGTHATPCRLAPVPTSTLCRFSWFCSLAYRAPYSTSCIRVTHLSAVHAHALDVQRQARAWARSRTHCHPRRTALARSPLV
ncbi:hypothetical protein B0H13DRAFT_2017938 [Mycena leptocephala]|nr:hypothetical protein B0H13DRAFT_2017938 [Mycena leptocephala]